MDLRQFRYFVALAEEAHFGLAAQRLHIVQPALSMQIRALEEEVGGQLFTRTTRRVELTEAGELLLVEARRTLAQAERAKSIVQDSLRGVIGKVKVGFVGNAVLAGKLVDDLRDFHRVYPRAEIELREVVPHLQAEAIAGGQIDVGYSPNTGLTLAPSLTVRKIGEWRFMVAMATDHRLAKRKSISIDALANESLILYAGDESDGGMDYFRGKLDVSLHASSRMSSTLSVLALAAAGMGVALVPDPVDTVAIPHLTYRPIAGAEISADLLLLHRSDETAGAVKAFISLALQSR